jgi:mono/diheme cytochrome c family protein
MIRPALVLSAGLLLLAACGRDDTPAPAAGRPRAPAAPAPSPPAPAASAPGAVPGAPVQTASAADSAKGRQVYVAQCVACHNSDPSKDGTLGPALKGSSRELLEARVLRAAYPPGYKPKRDSKVMPARPDLAGSVSDLAAYLN